MSRLTGLRSRLTAALLAISALTLAITAVLLLAPLDRRLRDDALVSLKENARTAKPTFEDLPPSAFVPIRRDRLHGRPSELERTAFRLRRRVTADVVVTDHSGKILASTDGDLRGLGPVAAEAIDARHMISSSTSSDDGDQGQVAMPFTVDDQSYALILRKSLTDLNAAQAVVRRALLVAGLIALGAALLVGIALATRLVRRITALRDTTLRVAELGPVAEVQADDTRDEIGDLTRAFATMQQRLRDQEESRRTFVATASHELRTPLASLLLMLHSATEDLDRPGPDVDDARDQLGRAIEQTERLTKLSSTLLDLSRLDAGLPLRSELVELVELGRSVVAEFGQHSVEQGTRIHLTGADTVWAIADPGSVAQVVRILIDNALRHAGGSGPIDVNVSMMGGRPRLEVRDAGPGVDPADAELVFERFRRGSKALSESGSGLGLAIGRELARKMGGDLRLVPEGPGARFVLDLVGAPTTDGTPS